MPRYLQVMECRPVDARRYAPATQRNRDPILAVLRRILPSTGTVLEIAAGTGEHAAYFAPRLTNVLWQPSDIGAEERASIRAWVAAAGAPNLLMPVDVDVAIPDWGDALAESDVTAIVAINLVHITPWRVCTGLMAGAGRLLPADGILYLYGPYMIGGRHTAPSNAAFDQALRAEDPEWGVRALESVTAEAEKAGLALAETVEMPANNLSVVFRRPPF